MECAICTQLIKDNFELECSHSFCRECIKEWFKSKKICPVCRASSEKFPDVTSTGIDYEYEEYVNNDDDNDTNYNSHNYNDYNLTDSSDSDEDYILDDQDSFEYNEIKAEWDFNSNIANQYMDNWYMDDNGLLMARPSWYIPHTQQIIGKTIRYPTHNDYIIDAGKQFEEIAIRSYENHINEHYNELNEHILNDDSDKEFEELVDELNILMLYDD